MSKSKKNILEKRIKQLVQKHRKDYGNIAISFLIAEMVIKTETEESRAADLRYKKIMNTLFGTPKALPKGEKDEELLIDAGWHFLFLGYDREEIYNSYSGPGSPETRACREAAKAYIAKTYYDLNEDRKGFTKEHKAEIDKIAKKLTDKFIPKREEYTNKAIYKELEQHERVEELDLKKYTEMQQAHFDKELQLIDLCRRKIINGIDFNFLNTKI